MARRFNGTSDFLRAAPAVVPSGATARTMFARFQLRQLPASYAAVIGQAGTFVPNNYSLDWVRVRSDGTAEYAVRDNNGSAQLVIASTPGVIAASRWHSVAAVAFTLNSTQLYVDGALVASGSGSNIAAMSLTQTGIGARLRETGNPTDFTAGNIAHAAIWSATLSAGEIEALHRGCPPPLIRPASLAASWPLRGLACDRPEVDLVRNIPLSVFGTTWAADPPAFAPAASAPHWLPQTIDPSPAGLGLHLVAAAPPHGSWHDDPDPGRLPRGAASGPKKWYPGLVRPRYFRGI